MLRWFIPIAMAGVFVLPHSAFSEEVKQTFDQSVNEQYGKTIIWVLHDLNHAQEFSHHAIMLEKGKVVAAGDIDLVLTAERVSQVYNTSVARVEVEGQTLLWPRTNAVKLNDVKFIANTESSTNLDATTNIKSSVKTESNAKRVD